MSGNRAWPRKGIKRSGVKSRRSLSGSRSQDVTHHNKWQRNTSGISKSVLEKWYVREGKSMQDIANTLGCSLHKITYWMEKLKIPRRSRSDASYIKHNPHGDPFKFRVPSTLNEAIHYGLGLGLYWGEGTKANKNSIRLGNTDHALITRFMEFLEMFYGIPRSDLRFGLQIFSDINPHRALDFWVQALTIQKAQFNKIIVTRSRSLGTYRKKSEFGVITVMYHNRNLRNHIVQSLPL